MYVSDVVYPADPLASSESVKMQWLAVRFDMMVMTLHLVWTLCAIVQPSTFHCTVFHILGRIDFNFLIKITDFGLTEDVYTRNYFRQGSSSDMVRLPVKWMAPESLSDGYFSEKSDVVRF